MLVARDLTTQIASLGSGPAWLGKNPNATITVGGKDSTKAIPNVNGHKWSNEAFVNLNYTAMDVRTKSAVVSFLNGESTIQVGSEKFFTRTLNDGALESGIVFATKPISNVIRLKVTASPNIKFNYQPPLTEAQIIEGRIDQPANVAGSYACYIAKANVERNGEPYMTGKFQHIYIWEVIDNNGLKASCGPLQIIAGNLVITMPQAFLNSAAYPVVAKGMGANTTFSYTVDGSSGFTTVAAMTKQITSPSIGTLDSVVVWTDAGTAEDIKGLVYTDSSGPATKIAAGAAVTTGGSGSPVEEISNAAGEAITAQAYWFGFVGNGSNHRARQDAETGWMSHYDQNTTYATPQNSPTGTEDADFRHSYYINYTISGGGGANPHNPLGHPIRGALGGPVG